MKKLLLVALAATLLAYCTPGGERIIERPESGLRNSQTLEIDKVVLNDTVTVLYVDAFYQPNLWIRIAGDTYLQANGEKYVITGADGIEIDGEHFIPESGEDSFVLYFPPLPKGVKSFDFIEGDCPDCFKIWDIDLTGNFKPSYGLPSNFRKETNADSAPLPEPELRVGTAKVKLNVYGLKEGYDASSVHFAVDNIVKGQPDDIKASVTGDNNYVYELPVYGTSWAMIRVGNNSVVPFIVAPGDDIEVHYDLLAASVGTSRYSTMPRPVYAGFTGKYAAVNNEMNSPGKQFDSEVYSIIFDEQGIWNDDENEYAARLRKIHDNKVQEIEGLGVSDNLKKVYMQDVRSIDIFNLMNEGMIRANSKYFDTGAYEQPGDNSVTDKKVEALKALEPGDPNWRLSRHFLGSVNALASDQLTDQQIDYVTGTQSGFLQDYRKAAPLYRTYYDKDIPESETSKINDAKDPFFKQAHEAMLENERIAKEKALAEGGFVIKDTPDVPPTDILDAIIAEYKGKVVFVDFWATWCGPCLNAMKVIKPFKPEMEEHGVVTIYISNESSPEAKWISMLPDIGGIHYYLVNEQWRPLCNKYDIQGIPQYMIYDKDGNKVFQHVGFPGVDRLREEFEKVW